MHFDDGAAVYHRPSGKTHFLNRPAVRLLERLSADAAATHEAVAAIVDPESGSLAPEVMGEVEAQLAHLAHLGLIRRFVP